jgi:hypothetical protein
LSINQAFLELSSVLDNVSKDAKDDHLCDYCINVISFYSNFIHKKKIHSRRSNARTIRSNESEDTARQSSSNNSHSQSEDGTHHDDKLEWLQIQQQPLVTAVFRLFKLRDSSNVSPESVFSLSLLFAMRLLSVEDFCMSICDQIEWLPPRHKDVEVANEFEEGVAPFSPTFELNGGKERSEKPETSSIEGNTADAFLFPHIL